MLSAHASRSYLTVWGSQVPIHPWSPIPVSSDSEFCPQQTPASQHLHASTSQTQHCSIGMPTSCLAAPTLLPCADTTEHAASLFISANDPGYRQVHRNPSFTCSVINQDARLPTAYNLTAEASPAAKQLDPAQQQALRDIFGRWGHLRGTSVRQRQPAASSLFSTPLPVALHPVLLCTIGMFGNPAILDAASPSIHTCRSVRSCTVVLLLGMPVVQLFILPSLPALLSTSSPPFACQCQPWMGVSCS